MSALQELKNRILADGSIDETEVAALRQELYADGQVDRAEVEMLIGLRNEAKETCASFDELFFEALTKCVLTDGSIDAEEANWLRAMLFADGKVDEAEKQFLRRLHTSARQISPEFQKLFDECLKL